MKRIFSLVLITLAASAFATPVPPASYEAQIEENLSTLTQRYLQHKEGEQESTLPAPECSAAPIPNWIAYDVTLGSEQTVIRFPHPPTMTTHDGYLTLDAADHAALYSYTLFNPPIQILDPSQFFDGFLNNLKKAGYVLGSYNTYEDINGYWILDCTSQDRKAGLDIHSKVIVTPYNLHMLSGICKKGDRKHQFTYFKENCSINTL